MNTLCSFTTAVAIIALHQTACALPIRLLSESYEVSGQFSDRASGQSGGYSASGSGAVSGSVGYTSLYEGDPYQNFWSSTAQRFSVSVRGDTGLRADGFDPYGTMLAQATWIFAIPRVGQNLLRVNFSVENTYLDDVDLGAISVSVARNGVAWDQIALDAYPDLTPAFWETSLLNSFGDIWELSLQIHEAAWDFDYVHVIASADLQRIPDAGTSGHLLALSLLAMGGIHGWWTRRRGAPFPR